MTATKPRVYCASPYHRAKMWRGDLLGPSVTIVSTWHNHDLDESLVDPADMSDCWDHDFAEIRKADCVLAYAEAMDRPNGTLVEIGYALAHQTEVHIVGNFKWGSWRHYSPLVYPHATLRAAVSVITGTPPEGIAEGDPL